jgi:hypothetical protein
MVLNQIQLFENEVAFESDRLQPEYADVPDNGGYNTDGSTNNTINHLTIKKCHYRFINSKQ